MKFLKVAMTIFLLAFNTMAASNVNQWIVIKAKVPGMTCQGCVQSITSALLKHHYQFASVNVETKLVEAKLPLEDKKMVLTKEKKESLTKQITAVIATAGSQYKVEGTEINLSL